MVTASTKLQQHTLYIHVEVYYIAITYHLLTSIVFAIITRDSDKIVHWNNGTQTVWPTPLQNAPCIITY